MSAISELSTIHRVKAKTPEEKRLAAKEAGRDNKAGYLFLLPWLIGLVVIMVGPMFASLYLSFTDYSLIQAPEWVGLENYVRMFSDPRLHKSISVTFIYVIVVVPLQLIVALGHRHAAERGDEGAGRSTGRSSTCRRCSAARWPLRCSGGRCSRSTAW